jgi:uncharacterized protein (DUF1778 family)
LLKYISAKRLAMRRPGQRPDRINLLLDRDTRRKLERAAAYEQKTLTNFVIDAALEKPRQSIARTWPSRLRRTNGRDCNE